MVGDAGEHIGDIMLRVESVELGAFDQRIDRGSAAAAKSDREEWRLARAGLASFTYAPVLASCSLSREMARPSARLRAAARSQ